MYCSSCGTAVPQNLSYCGGCGTKVGSPSPSRDSGLGGVSADGLIWAIVSVTLGMLALVIGLLAVMKKELGFGPELLIAFASAAFFVLLAIDGTFLWILLGRPGRRRKTAELEPPKVPTTRSLEAARQQMLHEPPPSVTEHTTRGFDPVPLSREHGRETR
jgi:hypothetical protein